MKAPSADDAFRMWLAGISVTRGTGTVDPWRPSPSVEAALHEQPGGDCHAIATNSTPAPTAATRTASRPAARAPAPTWSTPANSRATRASRTGAP